MYACRYWEAQKEGYIFFVLFFVGGGGFQGFAKVEKKR